MLFRYRKEHDKDEMEWERRMEVEENIQLIYDMQNAIHKNVRCGGCGMVVAMAFKEMLLSI